MLEKGTILLDQCKLVSLLSYHLLEEDFSEQTYKLMNELAKAKKWVVKCLYSTNANNRISKFGEDYMPNSILVKLNSPSRMEKKLVEHSFRLVGR